MHKVGIALLLFCVCFGMRTAQADEAFGTVKFMCREDLHYFEAEPVTISNPVEYDALHDNDFYILYSDPLRLRADDALRVCKLHRKRSGGTHEFTLHSVMRRGPGLNGFCGGGESEWMELRLNGSLFAQFVTGCLAFTRHFRIVFSDGAIEICAARSLGDAIDCQVSYVKEWLSQPLVFTDGS